MNYGIRTLQREVITFHISDGTDCAIYTRDNLYLSSTPGESVMFIALLGIMAFLGVILTASLCMIAGHADRMLEEIEQEMRQKSLEVLFHDEKTG
ncbi:MAG: hypothetical protein ACE5OP_05295 [Candidatus Glassbacteria bacterium]